MQCSKFHKLLYQLAALCALSLMVVCAQAQSLVPSATQATDWTDCDNSWAAESCLNASAGAAGQEGPRRIKPKHVLALLLDNLTARHEIRLNLGGRHNAAAGLRVAREPTINFNFQMHYQGAKVRLRSKHDSIGMSLNRSRLDLTDDEVYTGINVDIRW